MWLDLVVGPPPVCPGDDRPQRQQSDPKTDEGGPDRFDQPTRDAHTNTDGEDNASKNWTRSEVDHLIANKTAAGWTFVWLGDSVDPLIQKWTAATQI